MPTIYVWKGKNPKGRKVKGEMEANTPEQVEQSLQRRKITPTNVKKKPKDLFENIKLIRNK